MRMEVLCWQQFLTYLPSLLDLVPIIAILSLLLLDNRLLNQQQSGNGGLARQRQQQLIEVGELGFQQLEPFGSFHRLQLLIQVEDQMRMEVLRLPQILTYPPSLRDLVPIITILSLLLLDNRLMKLQQSGNGVLDKQKLQQLIEEEVLHFLQQEPFTINHQVKQLKHMEFLCQQKQFTYLQSLPYLQPMLASSFHLSLDSRYLKLQQIVRRAQFLSFQQLQRQW